MATREKFALLSFFSCMQIFYTMGKDETLQMNRAHNVEPLPKKGELTYIQYSTDKEASYLPEIRQLISKDLSEPYSIYVYRYFLYQWGDLCFMVRVSFEKYIFVH